MLTSVNLSRRIFVECALQSVRRGMLLVRGEKEGFIQRELKVLGPFGPKLLVGGLMVLLTLPSVPFRRSGHVIHAYNQIICNALFSLTLSDAGVWRLNLGRGGAPKAPPPIRGTFSTPDPKKGSQPQTSPRLGCYNIKRP